MKKTLLSAALMMVFSVTMLLGTTYAWWSETIEVSDNSLTTGKLEMTVTYNDPNALQDANEDGEWDWYTPTTNTSFFEYNNWQPGDSTTRQIKVKNDGTIPMAFKVSAVLENANFGNHPDSDADLADAVNFEVKVAGKTVNVDLKNPLTSPYIYLDVNEEITFVVTMSLPTSVENAEAMGIYFPITFEAVQIAQATGQQYDKNLNLK